MIAGLRALSRMSVPSGTPCLGVPDGALDALIFFSHVCFIKLCINVAGYFLVCEFGFMWLLRWRTPTGIVGGGVLRNDVHQEESHEATRPEPACALGSGIHHHIIVRAKCGSGGGPEREIRIRGKSQRLGNAGWNYATPRNLSLLPLSNA
jgi:hypothetical protein